MEENHQEMLESMDHMITSVAWDGEDEERRWMEGRACSASRGKLYNNDEEVSCRKNSNLLHASLFSSI